MSNSKHSAILYNQSIIHKLSEFSKPLAQFGISCFGLVRIFNNKWLITGTNQNWVSHFIDGLQNNIDYSKAVEKEIKQSTGFITYGHSHNELNFESYRQLLSYGLWNGLNIYNQSNDYIEYCYFFTNPNQEEMHLVYMKHIDLLKKFIIYFKDRAGDMLKTSDQELVKVKNLININFSRANTELQKAEKFFNEIILQNKKLSSLTQRELKCILHYADGYTMKEISTLLSISPRTVETYINNAKVKLKVHYKNELRDLMKTLSKPTGDFR